MTSPFTDLDRPPLRAAAVRGALVVEGGLWSALEVVEQTGSTNADVAHAAAAGAAEGLVVVAEHQSGGRGRADRAWVAPPRSGLTFSVLLRPDPDTRAHWGWLPLLVGVAVARGVSRIGEVAADLKWPNDVLIEDRKLAGVLAEVAGDAVVVGIGLNVSLRADELPVPTATSLLIAGSTVVDRDTVLRAVLRELATVYGRWRDHHGDAESAGLLTTYRELCTTIGRDITVALPDGRSLRGGATGVDITGQLLVDTADGETRLAAGDVVHVR